MHGQAATGYAGYFTGDVSIAGDLILQSTAAATFATRYVAIDGTETFEQSITGAQETIQRNWPNPTYVAGLGPAQYAMAPAHLPQGATGTSFACWFSDANPTRYMQGTLVRQSNSTEGSMTTMATVATTPNTISLTPSCHVLSRGRHLLIPKAARAASRNMAQVA